MIIVVIPVVTIAIELIAPISEDISIAFAVPTACDETPNDIPIAIELFNLKSFESVGPNREPNIPVKMTAAIVISGMAFILKAISLAIAVVTDFGINDIINV